MLRKQRDVKGALEISSNELRWRVDGEMNVSVLAPEVAASAHHLIEEFMVIANSFVAMRLVASFPVAPILRSHMPPLAGFAYAQALRTMGLGMLNMSNGHTICKSLAAIARQWQQKYKSVHTKALSAQQYAQ